MMTGVHGHNKEPGGLSHGHDHGHGHSHAPASFGRAFAIGTALNLKFLNVEVIYADVY